MRRIGFKLFLAIVGVNGLLALLAYLLISWSFGRGFVDYLNRSEQARLEPLVAVLAENYGRHQGWGWLAGDWRRWRTFLRRYFAGGERPEDGPANHHPLTFDPRLLLLDERGEVLIGRPHHAAQAQRKPIRWQGQVVGYLGYLPRQELAESIDRLFAARQKRNFAVVALLMLAAAVLLAAGIGHWLSRPVRALAEGTRQLIAGRYDVAVEVGGRDELAQLAADFNVLAATLEAHRRARQQWIADIAHELRTPLAVLRGEIEALQDGVRRPDEASLASLAQEVAQLARVVEDLHTLSLSDLGALSCHKEPLLLAELVEEVVEEHRGALTRAGIAAELRLDDDAVVLADPQRLIQLFANLIQNTLRYTDRPGWLRVALRREQAVIVDWQDSAPGVTDADLPRLTDRLYRVEGSRSRAGGGSGLGLAIARAIVEAHGGRMTARHAPLGGLWWEIAFPPARA